MNSSWPLLPLALPVPEPTPPTRAAGHPGPGAPGCVHGPARGAGMNLNFNPDSKTRRMHEIVCRRTEGLRSAHLKSGLQAAGRPESARLRQKLHMLSQDPRESRRSADFQWPGTGHILVVVKMASTYEAHKKIRQPSLRTRRNPMRRVPTSVGCVCFRADLGRLQLCSLQQGGTDGARHRPQWQ